MTEAFNQALEIARVFGYQLDIPLDNTLCVRKRETKPQSELNQKARINNVKSAFSITRTKAYRHVGIIDDVMTTGETIRALGKALRQSGIEEISVICFARAG